MAYSTYDIIHGSDLHVNIEPDEVYDMILTMIEEKYYTCLYLKKDSRLICKLVDIIKQEYNPEYGPRESYNKMIALYQTCI